MDFKKIEEKWQKRWEESKIFFSDPDNREKFFITAAFPYLNGVLHAGHLRTFTIPEVVARYQRMRGKNVLWTFGYHVTGTPILGLAEQIKERKEEVIWAYTNLHKIPEEILLKLTTPENIVEYFSKKAEEAFKKMGFSLDWRRKFTTNDEAFKKFIIWQFHKLKEKGYIVKGSHPVKYCPKCDNPVEDHDLLHGEGATLVEYILIKFRTEDNEVMPMATLRPETVFGVTNIWINPEKTYVRAKVNGETWILSKEAAEKLKYQGREVEILEEFKGEKLINKKVLNPVTNKEVPIFPAKFVKTNVGTGCVMSVPAHAPYDYIALKDLGLLDKIEIIPLIEVKGYGKFPAKEIVEKMNIKSQEERDKLEEATKKVYKDEFHKGVLNENCQEYRGIPVREAKDKIIEDLINKGLAEVMYEFSEERVVCRCGSPCIIKVVKDQWFIKYSDKKWKELAHKCVDRMNFIPENLRRVFHEMIDWMKDKACVRRRGLGTEFPFEEGWIIESLSDSTIYPAYYTIAKYVNEYNIKPEQLTIKLFDYIFLGKGELEEVSEDSGLDKELIKKMREEFLYYYPVDWRCSAKDLIPNHLTFYIFNHVAIFPEELWPRGIVVNGYVTIEGKKLSKSKGPLLPVLEVAETFGADVGRFYITTCAELPQDADIKFSELEKTKRVLERLYNFTKEVINMKDSEEREIDRWLLSKLNRALKDYHKLMEEFELRKAGILLSHYLLDEYIHWYRRRGGNNKELLLNYCETLVKMFAPFTPHLAEELWELLGKKNFISLERIPEAKEELIDDEIEFIEDYLKKLIEDIREIIKITKTEPRRIYIYTAEPWKCQILKIINENKDKDAKEIIKMIMKDPEFRKFGKEVPKLVNHLIKLRALDIDEEEVLKKNKEFLEKEFNAEIIINGEDKANKKRVAIPFKPAIYLE
ncbi:leucyl-tRNA synthetase [Methanocaldococcus infernus ME]|uniref:Leucine--tRNA ligase n=1 Tax=Methanocaldococcus infernus (strain DSM 11812 / JCM 15783 / ME) TaxID=573063 RepID=D5VRP3_METIM|nr:leucine--tRNA ligase [Methanocaldococcus infernus]ADG13246.1 leucyl-tRNA synthetase [Methanocaldococcus infernus ME]